MGMFSYNCKECNHPLLCPQATSKGINEWMSRVVVLTNRDETFIGEYDGYGRAAGEDDLNYHACLHEACWEKAGKPNFAHYGSPSDSAADQGWFFDDGDHDLIDPRITEGRDELLKAGVEARNKARYDQNARDLREMLIVSKHDDRTPCQKRFSLMNRYENGEKLPGQWLVSDKFHLLADDERYVSGPEAEIWPQLEARFNAYLESDEGKALLARGIELRDEGRRAYLAQIKEKGRFEVSYGPSRHPDLSTKPGGFQAYCPRYYVQDQMTYQTVAVYDYSGHGDDVKARASLAAATAAQLNADWAAAGYPWTWMEEE